MQPDPIGYGDGMNWYNYVGSDPVNGTDPSGLDCAANIGGCPTEVVVTGDCWSNPTCAQHRLDRIDAMNITSYAQWAQTASACNGNVSCGQFVQNRIDGFSERTQSLPAFLTYTGGVIGSGVAIGVCLEACPLAFTARAATSTIGKVYRAWS